MRGNRVVRPAAWYSLNRVAQLVHDLEGGGLLALDAMWVDRVHQRDGIVVGDVTHCVQCRVEVSFQGDDLGSVHKGLGKLVQSDFARRNDNDRAGPGPRRVGGHRGRSVAGGGAHEDAAARLERLGHGHHHAAVLERPRGVEPLVLEVEMPQAERAADVAARHKRGRAFVEIDLWGRRPDRQMLAIASDDTHRALVKRRAGRRRRRARARGAPSARGPSAGSSPGTGAS